ncbi:MAG: glycosyltransferase [Pirellula sp.]|nr:glycosyltransferase [Pirellula sp.]
MNALRSLGHDVVTIDTTLPLGGLAGARGLKRTMAKVFARSNNLLDWVSVNRKIKNASTKRRWDVLWVDKGQSIFPNSLVEFKKKQPFTVLVNYSPDDMFNPRNQTKRWLDGLTIYDLFVTTKTYNVAEYLQAGAKEALYIGNAYEPSVHKPMPVTDQERRKLGRDVVFVGACEPERRNSIEFLAQRGVEIGLWGGGKNWLELARKYSNVDVSEEFIADETYAKVLCSSKIALGFLRKANRDRQTTRSIEIPACGVFMLAERTDEHLGLFIEGQEAEFFETNDELYSKVKYYLSNEQERESIARCGAVRCQTSGYSNAERLRIVFDYLAKRLSGC